MEYNRHTKLNIFKISVLVLTLFICAAMLGSCGVMHQVFSKKTEVTFRANGGVITGDDVKTSGDGDSKGALEEYTHKCIVGDPFPDIKARKKYYKFKGWYTDAKGGRKVAVADEDNPLVFAHFESANTNRSVSITDIARSGGTSPGSDSSSDGEVLAGGETSADSESSSDSKASSGETDIKVRISKDEPENDIEVTFRLSSYYGQKVAFTNKKGKTIQKIKVSSGSDEDAASGAADTNDTESDTDDLFAPDGITVTTKLPDHKWMDSKSTTYYIRSFGNDHVDKGSPVKFKITLDGQYEYFDKPIEGSMAWYGGTEEAPQDRAGVIVATDDDFVYVKHESTNETEDGSRIYKWKKADVMINMADVRTDIVYDIYNAYSSKFFPIKGKAMYMDNGKKGLKRYENISKESAMHKNRKTWKTTFM